LREYAGYNTPLFDLGGLSSNNNFSKKEDLNMLETYFEKKISNSLLNKYYCLKTASLLRETMWSMVAEIISEIDFDYENYTKQNMENFNKAFKNLGI
jgi:Predicted choline kinase involved in LPS biosynthesis